ncbi:MAG TPA: thiamine pyrophosphate-dependent dehydrogenase E1 component subunit alpha [Acidimicrobiales bacterium]|nr:thiamine pyrophosphate-dependent dehydrogenase E1 component subunit alpha [Acidimicrobiales bacterium]
MNPGLAGQVRGPQPGAEQGPPPELPQLLLLRQFETALLELFAQGKVGGTTHTCLGQEIAPVLVSANLAEADFVFSNHRGHGHYLARYGDVHGLLAEILGREGAPCNGVGGSQHIYRPGYMSTGVQGASLPIALGVAASLKWDGSSAIACAYIGDGTFGEGTVYEALNLASLWQVPLLVVVENNGIAQSTPTTAHMAGTVAARAAAFGVRYSCVQSTDIGTARELVARTVASVRDEQCPSVIEFLAPRLGPHSKGDDTRPAHIMQAAHEADWAPVFESWWPDAFRAAARRQELAVKNAVGDVLDRPLSQWAVPLA